MLNHYPASPNGNQQSARVRRSNKTADPLVNPIAAEQLADFLGLDFEESDRALLDSFISAACEYYITYSNCELLSRNYTLNFSRFPEVQQGFCGLSPMGATLKAWVTIPLHPVSEISSITVDGDPYIDYTARLDDKPATVDVSALGEVEISYAAGYDASDDIPKSVINGIMLMASSLYENRGVCNPGDLAKASGAAALWRQSSMVMSI